MIYLMLAVPINISFHELIMDTFTQKEISIHLILILYLH